ncbi:MAG: hypothetical protein KGS48_01130 [Bacteroidetes bacterium]|nr:hypothetical protein [Bacteroidota bacterium]
MDNTTPNGGLSPKRSLYLALYNVLIVFLFSALLYQTILAASRREAGTGKKEIRIEKKIVQSPGKDTLKTGKDSLVVQVQLDDSLLQKDSISIKQLGSHAPVPGMIAYVLWAIFLAGGLGGALSNLRGIFEFSRDLTYIPAYLEIPFYIRPVSGVICGLFTFFVSSFFAGALTQGSPSSWQTLEGMFPYIGIAFIAGYASQEFMERLKETAKTLFGVPTQAVDTNPVPPNGEPQSPPEATENKGGGEESFNPNDPEPVKMRTPVAPPKNDAGPKLRRAD